MAIDFGTSHVKVTVGAPTGEPLASIKEPVAYFRSAGAPKTALEFDPAQVLSLIISVAQRAIGASNIAPSRDTRDRSYIAAAATGASKPRRPANLRRIEQGYANGGRGQRNRCKRSG